MKKKDLIIISICAREGSQGVKNKNIKEIGGKTLISRAIDDAQKLTFSNQIIFSSDSVNYLNKIPDSKKIFKIKRPKKLANKNSPKWHVFRHIIDKYRKLTNNFPSILVDLDVGTPFRKISDIEKCVKLLIKNKELDCVTTGYESERNPYFNMVQMKKNGIGKLVCNTSKLIFARQRAPKVLSLSPVCFAVKCSSIFKYENWSESNFKVHEISRESSIDIDTDFDFKIAKLLWNRIKKS